MLATEALAEFERQQLRNKEALNQLRIIINVQSGRSEPRNLTERLVREKAIRIGQNYIIKIIVFKIAL